MERFGLGIEIEVFAAGEKPDEDQEKRRGDGGECRVGCCTFVSWAKVVMRRITELGGRNTAKVCLTLLFELLGSELLTRL